MKTEKKRKNKIIRTLRQTPIKGHQTLRQFTDAIVN